MRLFSLLLLAVLASESYCTVWGPKDSSSGVRGSGQRRPQVFDIDIEDELQEVFSQATQADGLKR